jgi:hypothetical protein
MPHALRVAVLISLCLPVSARALTVSFSGAVESVIDGSHLLDASVTTGALVAGSYQVDPTSASTSSPFAVGPARLAFALGNYEFDASQNPGSIALINNRPVLSAAVDLWQTGEFVTPGLSPASGATGGDFAALAQIELNDFSASRFNGLERAPFVPSNLAGWDQALLRLDSIASNGSIDGRVQVQVNLLSWSVVPEPRSAVLLALGLVSLALRERRRARGRRAPLVDAQTRTYLARA